MPSRHPNGLSSPSLHSFYFPGGMNPTTLAELVQAADDLWDMLSCSWPNVDGFEIISTFISYYLVVPIGVSFSWILFVSARIFLCYPALLYYDWILTLPKEIIQFWKLPITLPAFLFFINRYLPIAGFIVGTLAYFTETFSSEVSPQNLLEKDCIIYSPRCKRISLWGLKMPIQDFSCANRVIPFLVSTNVINLSTIGGTTLLSGLR